MLLRFEGILNKAFGNDLNPFYYLGALGFYFFWVVAVSGAYIYIFYDTGVEDAFKSVESLTLEQPYLGGIMRSLHRYASDALLVVMLLHLLREYILGRYRGARWFAWFTGVPLIWLIFAAGVNGYWMVWDKLAQYSTVAAMEWFDWLPIFSEPLSQSFVSREVLNDRFFSLISFSHVTIPLIILFLLWVHIMRISYPVVNPRRGLALGVLLAMLVLSLLKPALSQGLADMGVEPRDIGIDWFYMFIFPLLDRWSAGQVWALTVGITLLISILPWLPTRNKQIPIAEVSLKNCNGCRRCVADCPYEAVVTQPRTDSLHFQEEAVVIPDRCVSCGICAGACPSSTPFRSDAGYVSGIEMPSMPMAGLRAAMTADLAKLKGGARVIVFGCDNAADIEKLRGEGIAVMSLPCTAMLPPSFIEYALHEHQADGVFITGCRENDCYHRMGGMWTTQRLTREREPRLRGRVERDRQRIRLFWASSADFKELSKELESFRIGLRGSASTQVEVND
ncbi:cytochrome b N-terminal domain-containing protein [Candidatus Ferrigenium straubiae]|jgi:ferredoxin/coenzyme F420-reducing hydrogenase delta subunit|uniref:cytochrome b N-terminal domain-containing protein n=1 Tax=Candidatus Ferrigenium straubiae TaxID=2919506 RepID=UPI003F4A8A0B